MNAALQLRGIKVEKFLKGDQGRKIYQGYDKFGHKITIKFSSVYEDVKITTISLWRLLISTYPEYFVPFWDYFEINNQYVFIMPYIEGICVCDIINSTDLDFKWKIIGEILQTMIRLADINVVHGDINVGNFIWNGKHAVLVDMTGLIPSTQESSTGEILNVRTIIYQLASSSMEDSEITWSEDIKLPDHLISEVTQNFIKVGWDNNRLQRLINMMYAFSLNYLLSQYQD